MSQGVEIKSSLLRATEGQRKCQNCNELATKKDVILSLKQSMRLIDRR